MTKHEAANLRMGWRILLIGLCFPWSVLAADPVPKQVTPPAAAAGKADKVGQPPEPDAKASRKRPLTAEQKQKIVALTSFVIAGIVSVLLMMFALMYWWSRRTHRLLREPLPAANRGDELWYLKAKRPPSPTTDPPPPESPPAPPSA